MSTLDLDGRPLMMEGAILMRSSPLWSPLVGTEGNTGAVGWGSSAMDQPLKSLLFERCGKIENCEINGARGQF